MWSGKLKREAIWMPDAKSVLHIRTPDGLVRLSCTKNAKKGAIFDCQVGLKANKYGRKRLLKI